MAYVHGGIQRDYFSVSPKTLTIQPLRLLGSSHSFTAHQSSMVQGKIQRKKLGNFLMEHAVQLCHANVEDSHRFTGWISHRKCHKLWAFSFAATMIFAYQVVQQHSYHTNSSIFDESPNAEDLKNYARMISRNITIFIHYKNEFVVPCRTVVAFFVNPRREHLLPVEMYQQISLQKWWLSSTPEELGWYQVDLHDQWLTSWGFHVV